MEITVEKYYNFDKTQIGVLVSPGYGAGFSTWYDGPNPMNLACDRRVIEYWLSHQYHKGEDIRKVEQDAAAFLETLGYHNVYCGGWGQLKLEWVPVGSLFRIEEYDGFESIEYFNDLGFISA